MAETFIRCSTFKAPPERVFDVSLDVDVHLASFSESDEQIVGGVDAGEMLLGDEVTWRARHFGIWWTMTSQITEYERPARFVDEQTRGPFKSFHHTHTFEQHPDGTTEMIDEITFVAPLGVLGLIAEKAVLGRYIPHLIDVRNRELGEQLDAGPDE